MHPLNPEHPSVAGRAVSVDVARPGARQALSPWWPARSRHAFTALALGLAAVFGVSALAIVLSSTHMQYPAANAFVRPYLAVAPVMIGLAWKLRRPDSPFGLLLIASGVAAWPLAWAASDDPAVHALGILVGDTANTLAIFFLALAFPVGRLQGRGDLVVMGLLATALSMRLVAAIGLPALAGGGPISRCLDSCPPNPFVVSLPAGLVEAASALESVLLLSGTALLIGIVARRLVTSPRPRRRALLVVALTSLLFFPLYFLYQSTRRLLGVEAPVVEMIAWAQIAARIVFPLGFALALVQADLFANSALRSLLDRLADRPSPDEWRTSIAESLDDPSLRLGFWDPSQRAFRQPEGSALEAPSPGSAWVGVSRGDHPVAALTVDDVLLTDPELVRAATNATLLAVELGTLEGELRDSRRATVEAGDTARRRVAQDLHDSAQQRLVALRMNLANARAQATMPAEREMLADLGHEVDEALGEIRAVLRGTRIEELHGDGLAVALERAARSTGVPLRFAAAGIGRYPHEIEEAVYYTVLEALQNVAKHNASGTRATITLAESEGALAFSVEDAGAGFDPRTASGDGLRNMRARIGSVGGQLHIESAHGAGTRVMGVIPLPPAGRAMEPGEGVAPRTEA